MSKPTPAARITAALEAQRGPTKRLPNGEIAFRCFHPEQHRNGDAHPSARWNEIKSVWCCDVCGEGGGALDAARRLGLDAERQRRVVRETVYPVIATDGRLVAEHVRQDFDDGSKTFYWRRNGQRGLGGLKPGEMPLYNLPALLAAPPDATVVVVEGEKAADALRQRGILAVATYGTGATPSIESLRPLVGHDVVAWADNDPAGREHMMETAARLANLGQTCRWLTWPDASPKGDAADYFALGGTAEGLAALIEAARPWQPPAAGKVATNGAGGFTLTPLADLLAEPDEAIPWLWDRTLPAGGLSILAAKPKVGKSTLARNLALAVARGEPFLGRNTAQGPVVYLALEEKRAEVAGHFVRMGADGEAAVFVHVGGAPAEAIAALRDAIAQTGAMLAIVDPLLRAVRLRDGNDYAEVTAALEPLLQLARATGCHILANHHLGKLEREGGDGILGSTALFGSVDTALMMRRRDEQRTIESVQRYGEDLPKTVLAWNAATGTVEAAGTVAELEHRRIGDAIREALADGEMTEEKLREAIGGNTGLVGKVLRQMLRDGLLERQGEGKKGDPYRYRILVSRFSYSDKRENEQNANRSESSVDDAEPKATDPWNGGAVKPHAEADYIEV